MVFLAQARSAGPARPCAADAAVALVVFTLGVLAVHGGRGQEEAALPGVAVLLGVVACAPLVVRRRWPLPVLAISTGGALLSMAVAEGRSPFVLAVVVAVYTVAAVTERITGWWRPAPRGCC